MRHPTPIRQKNARPTRPLFPNLATITLACAALFLSPAQAQLPDEIRTPTPPPTLPDSATRFGTLPGARSVSMSPDGSMIAFLSPSTGLGNDLYVVSTAEGAGRPQRLLRASGDPEVLNFCRWKSTSRLVCQMVGRRGYGRDVYGFMRYIGVDAAGGNVSVIGADEHNELFSGALIDWLPDDPDHVLIASPAGDVERRNIRTNRVDGTAIRRRASLTGRYGYITDGLGNIRIMRNQPAVADANYVPVWRYFYRADERDQWHPMSINTTEVNEGFRPVFVDAANNRAVGFLKVNGFDSVVAMSMDGRNQLTSLFQRDNVEIDDIVVIGDTRRIVGVSYATDRRRVEYFDQSLARMSQSLSRALGGKAITIVDQSRDGSVFLIFAGSDADPGRYYIYTPAARQLRPLLAFQPMLEGQTLSPVQSVSYPAADGTMIPGYLTLPPGRSDARGLPAIVMPHGGPSARDEGDFDWLAQYFASQGFAVLQPNYRGSSGYGDAWYVNNGFRSWRIAIGDISDGGRWLVSQGADPAKLSIVGWSYGGYSALQSGVTYPDLFKSIVAIAPVTDLDRLKREESRYYTGQLVSDFVGSGPHVREGSPALNASAISVPVLMFHGTLDTNVDIDQGRVMQRALVAAGRRSELIEYPGLDHQLPTSEARIDMLRRISAFLPR